VEIDLIVRGMCCLRPGMKGVSERIRVRSIVGRFLEHSRIFWFANGGQEEIYVSSADWMPRNLYERVEVAFPLRDELMKQRARQEILAAYLADNVKARILRPDGSYLPVGLLVNGAARRGKARAAAGFSAQEFLIGLAEGRQVMDMLPGHEPRRTRARKIRETR
jgi:polyphosphate kinase